MLQIDDILDERFYLSGECFTKGFVPLAVAPKGTRPPHKVPARQPAQTPTPTAQAAATATAVRPAFKPLQPTMAEQALATLRAPVQNGAFYSAKPAPPAGHAAGGPGPGHKPVAPRHDPAAPNAVVMARPNASALAIQRKHKAQVVDVVIDPILARALRPHQVDGVRFMYEAVMGMRSEGQGCILADEMGLGKTIQAITLIYTLLKQSAFAAPRQAIARAVIVCPVTLCQNWKNEITKWLGRDRIQVSIGDNEKIVEQWRWNKHAQVLILGYERLTGLTKLLTSQASSAPVGLIICDEGHRLKSKQSQINKALNAFTNCKMRVILSGTPVQNNLSEFHTMVGKFEPTRDLVVSRVSADVRLSDQTGFALECWMITRLSKTVSQL